jgi:hypothetical protein
MSNTDTNKKHNTENYRDEKHKPQQKTTQKTTEMSNTDTNKKHNTENYRDEQHRHQEKTPHRKLQR